MYWSALVSDPIEGMDEIAMRTSPRMNSANKLWLACRLRLRLEADGGLLATIVSIPPVENECRCARLVDSRTAGWLPGRFLPYSRLSLDPPLRVIPSEEARRSRFKKLCSGGARLVQGWCITAIGQEGDRPCSPCVVLLHGQVVRGPNVGSDFSDPFVFQFQSCCRWCRN